MAKTPPPQELVQAYQLIKQGQPQQAGQLLKTYLKTSPQDAEAWWLMAHAVSKPEHVRKALETALKCDPGHERARRKLAKLNADAAASPPDVPTASSPTTQTPPGPAARRSSTPAAPAQAAPVPASFEDYERTSAAGDPFASPVAYDPFVQVPTAPTSAFASTDTGTYDPFATSNAFDPSAAAHLRAQPGSTQAAGTGNQPDWGPGLAFIREGEQPSVGAKMDFSQFAPADAEIAHKSSYESLIGWVLGAVAIVVLIGLIAYFALNRDDKKVVAMETLNASTFTMLYPKGYDVQCGTESLGYQVCGIANHPMYNNLDLYLGGNVNIGNMLSDMLSSSFLGWSDLPQDSVSIIVMDVPERSSAYDAGSWAKTRYEYSQSEWSFLTYDDVTYNKQNDPPRQVNGRDGYYYEYIARDDQWGRDIAYDIYIPHDGLMLWMTVSINGPKRGSDYYDTVQAMIDSIQIKPQDQWGS